MFYRWNVEHDPAYVSIDSAVLTRRSTKARDYASASERVSVSGVVSGIVLTTEPFTSLCSVPSEGGRARRGLLRPECRRALQAWVLFTVNIIVLREVCSRIAKRYDRFHAMHIYRPNRHLPVISTRFSNYGSGLILVHQAHCTLELLVLVIAFCHSLLRADMEITTRPLVFRLPDQACS